MENIKNVLFDVDNTLINRNLGAFNTMWHFLDELTDVDPDSILGQAMLNDLLHWDEYGNTSRYYLTDNLKRYYGVEVDGKVFHDWWVDNLYRYEPAFESTVEVLEYLKPKYKLGIVTNGNAQAQRLKVTTNGLEDYFDAIVISGEIGAPLKPAPECFLEVLKRLDAKAEETVFVGDTYGKDILGATLVGMKAIWLWPDDGRGNSDVVTRIYDIRELMDIL